ncbi:MAG TPA: tetratricopeptide repeat protein [Terriglobia bacterium]|nr:tetratricopeptide repeat protein [Terriglobia bacterium]
MNLVLIVILLQTLLLPARDAIENPAAVSEVPAKLKKDYDKLWVRFTQGKDDAKLVQDLDKLLKKQNNLPALLMIEAYIDLYQNNETSAARKFEQVLAANPNNRIALYYLAEFAFARNDYTRASDLYSKLLAVDKSHPELETKRQKAFLLAIQNELQSQSRLAAAAAKEKKWDEALGHYRRELEMVGRNSEIEKNVAEALMNLGRTDEAREVLDRLRKSGSVDENLEAKVKELEDLGRWGNNIESFQAIKSAESVSREQLAAILVRYFPQITELRQSPQILTDIQDSPASAEIQTIVGLGLMDPLPNHTFQPSSEITRREFAISLARLVRLLRLAPPEAPPVPVSDVASSNALHEEIQLVLGHGLLTLDDDGNFRLDGNVSGEETVRAVERLLALTRKNA